MFSRGQADHIFAVLLLLAAAKSPKMTVESNVTAHVSRETFDNFCLYIMGFYSQTARWINTTDYLHFYCYFRRLGGTHLTTFYEPFKMIRLLDLIQIQIISLLLANLQWQLKCTVTQKDNATAGIINLLLFCNKERRCVVESSNVLQNTADVS